MVMSFLVYVGGFGTLDNAGSILLGYARNQIASAWGSFEAF